MDLTQQVRDIKKAFGQFSSSKTQICNTLKPTEIEFDAQEDVLEATQSIDFDRGDVMIKKSGIYLIIAGPQVAKLRGEKNRWIDFWLRVNNVDLPNSNVRRVILDSQEKDVIPINAVCPLNRGDTLNIMMAAETEGEGIGIEAMQPDGEPTIPSSNTNTCPIRLRRCSNCLLVYQRKNKYTKVYLQKRYWFFSYLFPPHSLFICHLALLAKEMQAATF